MRRLLAVGITVAMVASACGDDPGAGGPVGAEAPTALEAAEAAVDLLGDDLTAATAIVLALDRGYTLAQVVDAIMGGDLRDTGVVVRSGAVVEPEGTASDVIVDKSPPQARGTTVLALGIVAGGPAVTEEEFIGHLIAFSLGLDDEFERQEALDRAEAEERARQEQEEAAARAAQEERRERLRTVVVTFLMLNLSGKGYSAEQIVFAIVLGLVECDDISPTLAEWRCDIVGEEPADEERGVLASGADAPTTTTTTTGTTGAPASAPIEDGVYAAEIEIPDAAVPTLVAVLQNEVVMEVRNGTYQLWTTLEYVWEPCPNTSYDEFYGVGEVSTTHIVFRGTVEGSVTPGGTCTGGHTYLEHDWVHATVHITPDRYLECTCPLGIAYLVRVGD